MEIDVKHLLNMAGGDPDLADEVLDIFRTQAATWGRMLDPKAPAVEWADAAHTLKGSALSIGAHDFAELCAQAERLGRSGAFTPVEAAVMLSDVKAGLSQTLDACAQASYLMSKPGLRASNAENS